MDLEPTKPAAKSGRRGLWMVIGAVAAVVGVAALIEFGPWRGSKAAPQPSVAPIVTQAPAAAETPLQAPPAPPAPPVSKSPARVAARPRTTASGPPAQQAVAPEEQAPPPPVQEAPAPVAARPAESGPSRAELQAAREQLVMLNARAGSVRASLQSLQRSQAASGLNLRADMQQASSLMNAYLQGATDAFNANDLAAAGSLMDKAETQIDKLEKFLGR
jgi:hypothetical protein